MKSPQQSRSDEPFARAAFATYDIKNTATAECERLTVHVVSESHFRRVSNVDFVVNYPNCYVGSGAVSGAQFGDNEADAEFERLLREFYPEQGTVLLNVDAIGERRQWHSLRNATTTNARMTNVLVFGMRWPLKYLILSTRVRQLQKPYWLASCD